MYCQNPSCDGNKAYHAYQGTTIPSDKRAIPRRQGRKNPNYPSLEREADGFYHCTLCGWTDKPKPTKAGVS